MGLLRGFNGRFSAQGLRRRGRAIPPGYKDAGKDNKDGEEVVWENAYAHILVGGEKLGRGYTVEGLTVTYMPRGPGGFTADTIQQRARFLGYRSHYLRFCRVFLHPDVRGVYESYVRHEEHIRQQLRAFHGRDLREWKRAFYRSADMKPTRHNVLSTGYLRPKPSGGWIAPASPHIDATTTENNRRLILHAEKHIQFCKDARYKGHLLATASLQTAFENIRIHYQLSGADDAVKFCAANCHIADRRALNIPPERFFFIDASGARADFRARVTKSELTAAGANIAAISDAGHIINLEVKSYTGWASLRTTSPDGVALLHNVYKKAIKLQRGSFLAVIAGLPRTSSITRPGGVCQVMVADPGTPSVLDPQAQAAVILGELLLDALRLGLLADSVVDPRLAP